MNVRWTDTALAHLDAIHAYIAHDSPEYAKRMVDRLTRRSQQIASYFHSQGGEFPSTISTPFEKL